MIILEKDDVIAIQLVDHMSQIRLENFKNQLKDLLKVEVIFIPVGMSLEVYRKDYEKN